MKVITDILEEAVSQISDSEFLRAAGVEANTDISRIHLANKVFCVFDTLPTYESVGDLNEIYEVDLELKVLALADQNDRTLTGDDLRESLRPHAERIYSIASSDNRTSMMLYSDSMSISHENEVKLYDSVLTGLTLKFNLFIDRTVFC